MARKFLALTLLTALSLGPGIFGSAPARAAAYDPDLTWRTLETDHFRVTFHGGEEALAEEVAFTLEEIWDEMTAELDARPRRPTEVVLVDHTDSANGYATTLPVNTIVIFVTAPTSRSTLSFYEDWSDAILTHEFTHILHMDTVEGLPKLLRMALGRIISVNQVSPGWLIEGQATLQETWNTNGGRGRSTIADMVKRTAILEDAFPPLGNMDGWQTDPPGGNLRYLFGQDFQQYIADTTGRQIWTDWIHTYGGWIPYWLPSKKVFGVSYRTLYKGWKEEMTARYQRVEDRVRSEGLTPYTVLSDGEDSCGGPTYSPDGQMIVWACNDAHVGSDIYLAGPRGEEPEIILENRFASDFNWRADSEALVFSSLHTVSRFNLYSDVYFHKLVDEDSDAEGRVDDMTSGRRARYPTFSPDGRDLLVVTNKVQEQKLARLGVDRKLHTLVELGNHVQFSSPSYSPDGRHILLSMWKAGQRDLWLLDAEGSFKRRITLDMAADVNPRWSADGRRIYFSSDRTGIFNVYAIDLESEHLWQLTNVLGGAFRPVPNPHQTGMVFEAYTLHGADIGWMALDEASWRDRGLLPMPLEHRMSLAEALPETPIALPETAEDTDDTAEVPTTPAAGTPATTPASSGQARGGPARRGARSIPPAAVDPVPYDGIDGLGGPLFVLGQLPGRWGRPGEGPDLGTGDQPPQGPDVDAPSTSEAETPTEEEYEFSHPVDRYNPLPTLIPPRFLYPYIFQTSYGFMGVVATSGVDTLRRYFYSAWTSYRTDSNYLGWGASLALNKWLPVYSAGAYTYTVPYGDVYVYPGPPDEGGAWIPSVQSTNQRYWDKRTKAYAQMSYPLGSNRSIFGRWTGTHRTNLDPLPDGAFRPYLPTRGFYSSIGGGWRFAKGTSYAKSISPEEARVLSFVSEYTTPLLGAYRLNDSDVREPFTQLQVTGEWREYRTLPWLNNHVLAWKLASGAAVGDSERYGSYRLGGSYGESAYYTLPDEWRSLRGFPVAAVYGDWFYLGSMEYRLPVAIVDRGWGTLPFFARNISATAFVDAGNAFDGPEDPDGGFKNTRIGVGAELKATAVLGWGMGLSIRTGYGFALYGNGGYTLGNPEGFYAWLGSSF